MSTGVTPNWLRNFQVLSNPSLEASIAVSGVGVGEVSSPPPPPSLQYCDIPHIPFSPTNDTLENDL